VKEINKNPETNRQNPDPGTIPVFILPGILLMYIFRIIWLTLCTELIIISNKIDVITISQYYLRNESSKKNFVYN